MATYVFGAVGETGLAEGTYGYLQTYDVDNAATEHTAKDANGNTALQAFRDNTTTKKVTYIADTSTSLPVAGDTVSLGGTNYAVMMSSEKEANESFKSWDIELKVYVDNSVPSATTY